MGEPEATKAGSRAVTITAATFLVLRLASRVLTPGARAWLPGSGG